MFSPRSKDCRRLSSKVVDVSTAAASSNLRHQASLFALFSHLAVPPNVPRKIDAANSRGGFFPVAPRSDRHHHRPLPIQQKPHSKRMVARRIRYDNINNGSHHKRRRATTTNEFCYQESKVGPLLSVLGGLGRFLCRRCELYAVARGGALGSAEVGLCVDGSCDPGMGYGVLTLVADEILEVWGEGLYDVGGNGVVEVVF